MKDILVWVHVSWWKSKCQELERLEKQERLHLSIAEGSYTEEYRMYRIQKKLYLPSVQVAASRLFYLHLP